MSQNGDEIDVQRVKAIKLIVYSYARCAQLDNVASRLVGGDSALISELNACREAAASTARRSIERHATRDRLWRSQGCRPALHRQVAAAARSQHGTTRRARFRGHMQLRHNSPRRDRQRLAIISMIREWLTWPMLRVSRASMLIEHPTSPENGQESIMRHNIIERPGPAKIANPGRGRVPHSGGITFETNHHSG